jgi:hypothetical protein
MPQLAMADAVFAHRNATAHLPNLATGYVGDVGVAEQIDSDVVGQVAAVGQPERGQFDVLRAGASA